ncbi:MAG TPA: hypothetical protein VGM90_40915 [Kofleriaceae bacterium]|jgi:hypothetical protein
MSAADHSKQRIGASLKFALSQMTLPEEATKKVTSKMRLEATLRTGASVSLACTDVSSGRPYGCYGLYWVLSLKGGPTEDAMIKAGLHAATSWSGPGLLSVTSHQMEKPSHVEVTPKSDPDGIAVDIVASMKRRALPLIAAFEQEPEQGADLLLTGLPLKVRNPFTTTLLLLLRAQRRDRFADVLAAAPNVPTFYDFAACANPEELIVKPLLALFS